MGGGGGKRRWEKEVVGGVARRRWRSLEEVNMRSGEEEMGRWRLVFGGGIGMREEFQRFRGSKVRDLMVPRSRDPKVPSTQGQQVT